MEELTAQFLMVHESDDGLQWESLQAAAAGQQIWVLVGPGLAVCREEAGGERWGGARLGVSKGSKVERGNPEVRGEGWGGQAVPGPSPGERHPPEVPVHAGARAGDPRPVPGQRGTSRGSRYRQGRGLGTPGGPRSREASTRGSRCPQGRRLGTHRKVRGSAVSTGHTGCVRRGDAGRCRGDARYRGTSAWTRPSGTRAPGPRPPRRALASHQ